MLLSRRFVSRIAARPIPHCEGVAPEQGEHELRPPPWKSSFAEINVSMHVCGALCAPQISNVPQRWRIHAKTFKHPNVADTSGENSASAPSSGKYRSSIESHSSAERNLDVKATRRGPNTFVPPGCRILSDTQSIFMDRSPPAYTYSVVAPAGNSEKVCHEVDRVLWVNHIRTGLGIQTTNPAIRAVDLVCQPRQHAFGSGSPGC